MRLSVARIKRWGESVDYEFVTETVAAHPLAAVRRRVMIGEVSTSWRPALDRVWAFLRSNGSLRTDGHNVFVYHHPAALDLPMEVDFGVQVVGAFAGDGEVVSRQTPAGPVASTLHIGPYERLGDAHSAIHSWRAAHGRSFAGISWEIYGDWNDDPAKLEVRVLYLLD